MPAVPEVTGVRDVLKALGELEPKLKREAAKSMRQAVSPLESAVKARIPGGPPLSGWRYGRYAYDGGSARGGVRVRVGGRQRASGGRLGVFPLVTLEQTSAAGIVFDMAGRRSSGRSPQGRAFIAGLNSRYGGASRSMWPAAEKNLATVQSAVLKAADEAAKQVQAKIGRR